MLIVTGFNGQQEYYWRVAAQNPAGTGDYSEPFKFRTAFPGPPLLTFPENGMNEIPLDTTLYWHTADSADSYRLQLSQSQNFQETYIKLDTILYNDTSLTVTGLEPYKRLSYYWRVMAFNDYGSSNWSETWNFRTVTSTSIDWQDKVPLTYRLKQNYPNPFNPNTTITFSLAKSGQTILRVFDILGRQVAVLKDEDLSAGQYSIQFDGTKLASGVYIYQLISNDIILNKKMVLMK